LHTQLRDAVERQDYMTAGQISEALATALFPEYPNLDKERQKQIRFQKMSWKGLGAAPWLAERLDALHYTFPTTIQINALQAVNAILLLRDDDDNGIEQQNGKSQDVAYAVSSLPSASSATVPSLEERIKQSNGNVNMGIVVSGTTGSGKTLSYAVPLLSTLSESLFVRQRLRVSDEEAVGDTAGDLADRISVVTSPRISSLNTKDGNNQKPSNAIATGAALSTLGKSGRDVTSPLALIILPTRELGVQTATLLYQLVGGSTKTDGKASLMNPNKKYKGPKGIRIACVLDKEEAAFGLKLQTDIAITTPQFLGKLLDDGDVDPQKLRVIIFDEADLVLEQMNHQDLGRLFTENNERRREFSRLTVLVGASVTEALGKLAVQTRVLPPKSYIATATGFARIREDDVAFASSSSSTASGTLTGAVSSAVTNATETTSMAANDRMRDGGNVITQPKTASLKDLDVCLYPGLKHERVIVPNDKSGLLVLTRLLRQELQNYEQQIASAASATATDAQRPRVVVFFPNESMARAAIEPLRDALWGEHKLCVLLPKTGVSPLGIMEQFKTNQTSVMLATPNSVRGLDFPALTHVYTMYLPMDDPREYLHLAGRVGRVGHRVEGRVISVLQETEADKMNVLAQTLGFAFTDIEAPKGDTLIRTKDGEIDENAIDIERLRRVLEDTLSLMELAPDPEGVDDPNRITVLGESEDDEDDDEEDDDIDDSESDNDNQSKSFQ
jgi:superfamily II DNA/RNA helicase